MTQNILFYAFTKYYTPYSEYHVLCIHQVLQPVTQNILFCVFTKYYTLWLKISYSIYSLSTTMWLKIHCFVRSLSTTPCDWNWKCIHQMKPFFFYFNVELVKISNTLKWNVKIFNKTTMIIGETDTVHLHTKFQQLHFAHCWDQL